MEYVQWFATSNMVLSIIANYDQLFPHPLLGKPFTFDPKIWSSVPWSRIKYKNSSIFGNLTLLVARQVFEVIHHSRRQLQILGEKKQNKKMDKI